MPDGYIVRGDVHTRLGNIQAAKSDYYSAFKMAPGNPEVLKAYGNQLLRDEDESGADLVLKSIENQYSFKDPEYYLELNQVYLFTGDTVMREKLLKKAKGLSPSSYLAFHGLALVYLETGQYEKGIHELEQAEKIRPGFEWTTDMLGWLHYSNNDFERAAKYFSQHPEFEGTIEDSTQISGNRHRLAMVYSKMGRKKEAEALIAEEFKVVSEILTGKRSWGSWPQFAGMYYVLAVDNAYMGNGDKAVQYLDSAFHYHFYWPWGVTIRIPCYPVFATAQTSRRS